MKRYNIRQYVAWLTLIPLLIMAVSLETYFLHDRFTDLDHNLVERGKLITRQLASSSEYGVFSNNAPFLNNLAQGVLQQPDVRGVIILNAVSESLIEAGEFSSTAGNTVVDTNPTLSKPSSQVGETQASRIKQLVNPQHPVLSINESLWVFQPIIPVQVALDDLGANSAVQQVGAVIIEMSWARTNKLKSQLLWVTIGLTGWFLIFAIYLVMIASRSITSPICQLSEVVQKIGEGNLKMRGSVTTRITELRNLARGINAMAAKLQQESVILHQRAEEATRLAAIAFETHEAILITDVNANIIRVNQAFQDITGYSAQEVLGNNPRILSSGHQDKAFYTDMWQQLLSNGTWSGEIWDKRKNGQIYPKWLTITAVKSNTGQTSEYVAIFNDITARKQAEEEIRNLAFYDALTQLPNRRLLMDRLRSALSISARSNHYGALLFLDMDRFKVLNDTLGHDYGDLLLVEVAARIQTCVRDIDTVARLGGDEFVILLEEVDEHAENASQKVALIAEKIRASLTLPYQLKGNEQHSSPSIGVSLYRGTEESADALLKHADMAMYQAKDSGRNTVRFFDPAMQLAVETRAAIEADLRHAVPDQQLHLHYQIQVDSEHRPIGAEALVRWIHPNRGIVPPAQFIPIAEESSLILDIGDWVLDTACRQLALWAEDKQTSGLTLAVNVSAQQFKQNDFVENIATALRVYNVAASRLKLELTESVVLNDVTDVVAKMHALKALGVQLSLDDFGTGYSSLSYLKQLPLDQLKIDQSFVRDIATDPSNAVMVQAIIDMGHNFRLNVIAEGVETEAQLAFLKEHGCMAYQGYFFGKPEPIEQFEALLKHSRSPFIQSEITGITFA